MSPSLALLVDSHVFPGSPAEEALTRALREVGLRESEVPRVRVGQRLPSTNVLVALGDASARACGITLPTMSARGYAFETPVHPKVLASIDPQLAARVHVPWYILLATDLKRARDLSYESTLRRPKRDVHVVRSHADAHRCAEALLACERLACDIEIYDTERLACIGFAESSDRAVVFPAQFLESAALVLARHPRLVFQNGQFDLHFLLTRCGIRVRGFADDTLIAWHACYPELAGASTRSDGSRVGAKRTHKSLAFFASLYTLDAWWKDYEFANDHEMYVLNGRDCAITFEVMKRLDAEIARLDVGAIYAHELSLVWPCVEMQARGLAIDDTLRRERMRAIDARVAACDAELEALVLPLLEARLEELPPEVARLFRNRRRCTCCGGGKLARTACWRCAGFEKKPGKRTLAESARTLSACAVCGGAGEHVWLSFNGRSVPQKQAVLYDVLKLPKRYRDGKLSTDEDALRALLATLA